MTRTFLTLVTTSKFKLHFRSRDPDLVDLSYHFKLQFPRRDPDFADQRGGTGQGDAGKTTRLHVGRLTRNVTQEHIQEIFSNFGKLKSVDLAIDNRVNLPRGFAYVVYETRAEADLARLTMDGGQLDGNVLSCASLSPFRFLRLTDPFLHGSCPLGLLYLYH